MEILLFNLYFYKKKYRLHIKNDNLKDKFEKKN